MGDLSSSLAWLGGRGNARDGPKTWLNLCISYGATVQK
jgi:hypothetical protein